MQDLTVSVIQSELFWEDPEANREAFAKQIAGIENSDLIILPEMFTTGFSMRSNELAETMVGPSVAWMKAQARNSGAAINGSLIIKEEGKYYNRSIFTYQDGRVEHYDKRHLFRMADEHAHFSEGTERKIVELKGWRICLQVCYDLRFPVFSRNQNDYDLLIYVANWPEARADAWSTLLKARAIENQCYLIGVNRIGADTKGISYSGASVVLDAKGDELVDIGSNTAVSCSATLSKLKPRSAYSLSSITLSTVHACLGDRLPVTLFLTGSG